VKSPVFHQASAHRRW